MNSQNQPTRNVNENCLQNETLPTERLWGVRRCSRADRAQWPFAPEIRVASHEATLCRARRRGAKLPSVGRVSWQQCNGPWAHVHPESALKCTETHTWRTLDPRRRCEACHTYGRRCIRIQQVRPMMAQQVNCHTLAFHA